MRSGLALVLLITACSSSASTAPTPTAPTTAASSVAATAGMSTGIQREHPALAVLPWERDILDAFSAAGIDIRLIGGSKFEGFLGSRHEARVFIGGSTLTYPSGADVLYLPAPRTVRMCSSPSTPGFTRWSLWVDDKPASGMEGTQTAYPLVGVRFFAIAWDAHSASALAKGLSLRPPSC